MSATKPQTGMAAIKIPTSFNIDVEFEIPEFYRRLVSLIIDVVIECLYLRIAWAIFSAILSNSSLDNDNTYYNLEAVSLLLVLLVLIYHVVLEITMNGQSFGKKIMGIRVVNENGGRPSISQFLIRWLLRISDVWVVALLFIVASNSSFQTLESTFITLAALGFLLTDVILILASKKRQRIGDILARTILIRTNTKASIEETVFQEVADTYTPQFPMIMQLSDRDINAIKSILETAKKKGDFQMASAASDKIKGHLNIETQLSPFEFLDTLLKDYNYLSVK